MTTDSGGSAELGNAPRWLASSHHLPLGRVIPIG